MEAQEEGKLKRSVLVQRGYEFEKLVADIFNNAGWESHIYERCINSAIDDWDVICESGDEKCYIEVKLYRSKYMGMGLLKDILFQMNNRRIIKDENAQKVLVIASSIRKEYLAELGDIDETVTVLDLGNLLFLVQNNEQLKNRLMAFIEFTVEDIPVISPGTKIIKTTMNKTSGEINDTKMLIEYFDNWKCSERSSGEYEKLCSSSLKKLFIKDLSLWEEQKKSNDDLFRFDLICKIKDDDVSPLWKFIEDFFNSKYIVFEFKNYENPITQKEVYTTEKYLYAKALRSVAIIITANGYDKNSYKAIKGILRDEGKLIIVLSNEDMVNMLCKIENQENPSDYIYDKLDKILIELEK